MGMKELRAKYGDKKRTLAINAAIRAEIPGGSELLDLVHLANHLHEVAEDSERPKLGEVLSGLKRVKKSMFLEICKRYEIEERNDGQK